MEAKRRSTTAAAASSHRTRSTTHISSLGDDVVSEIFLRLPSIVSIARAACACRHWLAVVSSPDFVRRFLGVHRCPPLVSFVSPDFSYHPVGGRDGGGDPGLTAFLRRSYISYWVVWDCRHGLLITSTNGRWPKVDMTVYDPVSGRCFAVHRRPPRDDGIWYFSDCLLPAADDDSNCRTASFRVVSVQCHNQRTRAAVYDNDNKKWTLHPWVAAITPPTGTPDSVHASPMHAASCVYWKYPKKAKLLSLDTLTMGFAVVPLPPGVSATTPYAVGETKNAECCLVAFTPDPMINKGQVMQVWFRREGDEAQLWALQRQVSLLELEQAIPPPRKVGHVRAVAAGVVLVCLCPSDGSTSLDHVAFCLESFKVEARFKSGQSIIYPYQMMPSVLGKR